MRKISEAKPVYYTATTLVHADHTTNIKERFDAVMKYSHIHKLSHFLLTLCCIFMLALSYILISQPVYDNTPQKPEPGVIYFDASNSHIELRKDGTYWLCSQLLEAEQISQEEALFYKKIGFSVKIEE